MAHCAMIGSKTSTFDTVYWLFLYSAATNVSFLVEFVNKDFIAKHFSNSQGDLYKPDGTGSDLQRISDDFSSYSGVELKTNEDSSDNGAFIDFINAMDSGDALSVIEQDSVLRYLAVSVALANLVVGLGRKPKFER